LPCAATLLLGTDGTGWAVELLANSLKP